MKDLSSLSLFEFPLRRPVTITMIVLTALVLGSLSYRLLPIDIMPPINYPSLTIRTEYSGASPEEVEEIVTEPLEQNLGVVRNLVTITSSSRPGVSEIELEFTWQTDINQAIQDVRERLDQVILPEEVEIP
ncbi:MAG: efflux RND transporter permease subunit, partial [bacterium]